MSDGFQVARLIPVSGIANNVEAEMRATSALLSVMTIVRDFSTALLSPLGASTARRATVESFIETRFKLTDGTVVRPDGLVQVTYGSSTWKALVEVKTGDNLLEPDQINNYLSVAREQGIDAVVSISNEIAVGDRHPCEGVRIRANSRTRLAHYSWTEILAHAIRTKVHRGIDDPEQAWILGELVRYLEHPASGAMAFNDMGGTWVSVRDGAREGTLRKTDPEVREFVGRWDQLLHYAALRLGADTGTDVQHVVPRAHADPKARTTYLVESLTGAGTLDGVIRVPGAAGNVTLAADLRARRVSASADIGAPLDRGNRARITWLARQLGPETPGSVIVEAWGRNARQPVAATVAQLREDRDVLVDPDRRELTRFRLVQRGEMGQNRKDGGRTAGFIESVTRLLDAFYIGVLQQVVPWTARAPQARSTGKPTELVEEPIEDAEALDEAIEAARAIAAEETGSDVPPARDDIARPEETAAPGLGDRIEDDYAGEPPAEALNSVDGDFVAALPVFAPGPEDSHLEHADRADDVDRPQS